MVVAADRDRHPALGDMFPWSLACEHMLLAVGLLFIVAGAAVEPDSDVLRNADLRTVCFVLGGLLIVIDTLGRRSR
jgi:hypothetical protein